MIPAVELSRLVAARLRARAKIWCFARQASNTSVATCSRLVTCSVRDMIVSQQTLITYALV
eukprot:1782216-Amphidinium_carterae.4